MDPPGRLAALGHGVGLEAFREKLTTAEPGRLIGVLLPGVERDDLSAGTVLVR